ncbi:hypothetical protein ACA910_008163 [Epithemia clementina (nom. ined.)]
MVEPRNALKLLDDAIADLEAKLNLKPGEDLSSRTAGQSTAASDNTQSQNGAAANSNNKAPKKGEKKKDTVAASNSKKGDNATAESATDQPDICKLEFKVGQIVKVWVHPDAEKLYCEEIDVGESSPRQIASGLRPHFTEEQMLGQRLLVVSNLKPKNLVGFKSHGMVLCAAAAQPDGTEVVEFVEPPAEAAIGEVVTFDGLPTPEPWTPAQVEKKKIWQAAATGMQTTDDCCAAWNGHVFMTRAGPCRTKTIAGGPMR